MEWIYDGRPVTEEDLIGKKAFVYIITNLFDNKKYIGKKKLFFKRKKTVKNRKRKVTVTIDSDWQTYYGSSKELLQDLTLLDTCCFKREILRFCDTPAESSYWELWYQMTNHVLLSDDYYNSYVGARIHRSHVNKNYSSPSSATSSNSSCNSSSEPQ